MSVPTPPPITGYYMLLPNGLDPRMQQAEPIYYWAEENAFRRLGATSTAPTRIPWSKLCEPTSPFSHWAPILIPPPAWQPVARGIPPPAGQLAS